MHNSLAGDALGSVRQIFQENEAEHRAAGLGGLKGKRLALTHIPDILEKAVKKRYSHKPITHSSAFLTGKRLNNLSLAVILSLFTMFSGTGVYAGTDYITIGAQPFSIHPDNQKPLAKYYERKLDHDAIVIFTPGAGLTYDRSVSMGWFTHIRYLASFMSDCANMPAGYAAISFC